MDKSTQRHCKRLWVTAGARCVWRSRPDLGSPTRPGLYKRLVLVAQGRVAVHRAGIGRSAGLDHSRIERLICGVARTSHIDQATRLRPDPSPWIRIVCSPINTPVLSSSDDFATTEVLVLPRSRAFAVRRQAGGDITLPRYAHHAGSSPNPSKGTFPCCETVTLSFYFCRILLTTLLQLFPASHLLSLI
ncbi:hypothetical protein BDV96DRAFT_395096 [Lophiotrema nucula]|uniref:Uncharacterized protein n=1 Tax=Lophiotrema nucula TaxID=690887 RepID=A0A6A5ZEC0_9PLEO|nr:hypothetical protein BDV96DRAFT_395096 [Lophiotrema nucula]